MSIHGFGKTFIVSGSWLLVAIVCATEGPFHFHLISKNQFSKTLNEESDNIFSRFRFFVKFQMLFLNNSAHSIFFEAKADSQNIVSNVCLTSTAALTVTLARFSPMFPFYTF